MSIETNVAASKAIAAFWELADELIEGLPPDVAACFWKGLATDFNERFPREPVQELEPPMTDEEARKFGSTAMPFGKHQGSRIDEVPLDYLLWMSEDTFSKRLRRYVKSRRVQAEQMV